MAQRYGSSCPQQRFVIPQFKLNERLERDVTNIIARMYEDLTPDSEDCKIPGLVNVLALNTFPSHGLTINVTHTRGRHGGIEPSCHCASTTPRVTASVVFAHEGDDMVIFWRRVRNRWNCYVRAGFWAVALIILITSRSYDGWSIVSRSIEIGKPIIFVSMNYR